MSESDDFNRAVEARQVAWRKANMSDQREGLQGRSRRPWILPAELWTEGLWPPLRESLPTYLTRNRIEKHKGAHNLKSSWILCANLYFAFNRPEGLPLLTSFLQERISPDINAVESVELEYAEPSPLDPQTLLGEPPGGRRGAQQTSPDLAFIVRTSQGRGLVLTENKFTEHWFYDCSGRKRSVNNPDAGRCLAWEGLYGHMADRCWQLQWPQGRRNYWDNICLTMHAIKSFKRCPAALGGYQLFRQQALAEAIARTGRYDLVASCVAYDRCNRALVHCLRDAGIEDFTRDWRRFFDGLARFSAWTHQSWVTWVSQQDQTGFWNGWLRYVKDRYGYVDPSQERFAPDWESEKRFIRFIE